MGTWKWSTYFLFFIIAFVSAQLIKMAELHGVKKYNNRLYNPFGFTCYAMVYLLWIALAITRNIEMYPEGSIDMKWYVYAFQEGLNAKWDWLKILTFRQWEPFYYGLTTIIRYFTANYRIYWLVMYSLITIGFLKFLSSEYKKYIDFNLLPMFFIVFLYSLSAVRTGLSVAFALIGITQLVKGKHIKFVIWVIAGTFFHYLAILVLPCMVFLKIVDIYGFSRKKVTILTTVCLAIALQLIPIGRIVIASTKYKTYLGLRLTLKGQLVVIILALLCIYFYNDIYRKFGQKIIFIHIVLYNFLIIPFIIEFNIYRINHYFLIIRLIAWSMVLRIIKEKYANSFKGWAQIVTIFSTIMMLIWFTKTIFDMKTIGIMPYFTHWI